MNNVKQKRKRNRNRKGSSVRFISPVDKMFYKIDRVNLLKEQHYKCKFCKVLLKENEGTMDHVIPKSKLNNYHSTQNCVVACSDCNSKKGNNPDYKASEWDKDVAEVLNNIEYRTRKSLYRLDMNANGITYNKWIKKKKSEGMPW